MSPCGNCGHAAHDHEVLFSRGLPDSTGAVWCHGRYGRCQHEHPAHRGASYVLFARCACSGYAPEDWPALTALIGFEARHGIEQATGAHPYPKLSLS